ALQDEQWRRQVDERLLWLGYDGRRVRDIASAGACAGNGAGPPTPAGACGARAGHRCGAGLSTRALFAIADHCFGLEPLESMLRWAVKTAPCAQFAAGIAEAIPFRTGSIELMTAAGSLNYVRLDDFFSEAARVLTPDGVIVVYDFGPGRSFRQTPGLDDWFKEFTARYPL